MIFLFVLIFILVICACFSCMYIEKENRQYIKNEIGSNVQIERYSENNLFGLFKYNVYTKEKDYIFLFDGKKFIQKISVTKKSS